MHGLTITSVPEGRSITVHPYLGNFGRREIQQVIGGLALGYGLLQVARWSLTGGLTTVALVAYVLAVLTVAGGLGSASFISITEHRRSQLRLEVRLGGSTVELVWRRNDAEVERVRHSLADVGRVDVREVGYQRSHVVARLASGAELTIPMERDPQEAARWLAEELTRASREARGAS